MFALICCALSLFHEALFELSQSLLCTRPLLACLVRLHEHDKRRCHTLSVLPRGDAVLETLLVEMIVLLKNDQLTHEAATHYQVIGRSLREEKTEKKGNTMERAQ